MMTSVYSCTVVKYVTRAQLLKKNVKNFPFDDHSR